MAKSVKTQTMVQMVKELENFKGSLVLALSKGSQLSKTNSEVILQKYIKEAVIDLKTSMPLRTARAIAKNTLTPIMLDTMK